MAAQRSSVKQRIEGDVIERSHLHAAPPPERSCVALHRIADSHIWVPDPTAIGGPRRVGCRTVVDSAKPQKPAVAAHHFGLPDNASERRRLGMDPVLGVTIRDVQAPSRPPEGAQPHQQDHDQDRDRDLLASHTDERPERIWSPANRSMFLHLASLAQGPEEQVTPEVHSRDTLPRESTGACRYRDWKGPAHHDARSPEQLASTFLHPDRLTSVWRSISALAVRSPAVLLSRSWACCF